MAKIIPWMLFSSMQSRGRITVLTVRGGIVENFTILVFFCMLVDVYKERRCITLLPNHPGPHSLRLTTLNWLIHTANSLFRNLTIFRHNVYFNILHRHPGCYERHPSSPTLRRANIGFGGQAFFERTRIRYRQQAHRSSKHLPTRVERDLHHSYGTVPWRW